MLPIYQCWFQSGILGNRFHHCPGSVNPHWFLSALLHISVRKYWTRMAASLSADPIWSDLICICIEEFVTVIVESVTRSLTMPLPTWTAKLEHCHFKRSLLDDIMRYSSAQFLGASNIIKSAGGDCSQQSILGWNPAHTHVLLAIGGSFHPECIAAAVTCSRYKNVVYIFCPLLLFCKSTNLVCLLEFELD